jgi:hypothetical protein
MLIQVFQVLEDIRAKKAKEDSYNDRGERKDQESDEHAQYVIRTQLKAKVYVSIKSCSRLHLEHTLNCMKEQYSDRIIDHSFTKEN